VSRTSSGEGVEPLTGIPYPVHPPEALIQIYTLVQEGSVSSVGSVLAGEIRAQWISPLVSLYETQPSNLPKWLGDTASTSE